MILRHVLELQGDIFIAGHDLRWRGSVVCDQVSFEGLLGRSLEIFTDGRGA